MSIEQGKTQTQLFEQAGGSALMAARDTAIVEAWIRSATGQHLNRIAAAAMMRTLGFSLPAEAFEEIFVAVDEDGSGTIGKDELHSFLSVYREQGWTHHHDPYGGMDYHVSYDGRTIWGGMGMSSDASTHATLPHGLAARHSSPRLSVAQPPKRTSLRNSPSALRAEARGGSRRPLSRRDSWGDAKHIEEEERGRISSDVLVMYEQEHRRAEDGYHYTKELFMKHYGGTAEWDAAEQASMADTLNHPCPTPSLKPSVTVTIPEKKLSFRGRHLLRPLGPTPPLSSAKAEKSAAQSERRTIRSTAKSRVV